MKEEKFKIGDAVRTTHYASGSYQNSPGVIVDFTDTDLKDIIAIQRIRNDNIYRVSLRECKHSCLYYEFELVGDVKWRVDNGSVFLRLV